MYEELVKNGMLEPCQEAEAAWELYKKVGQMLVVVNEMSRCLEEDSYPYRLNEEVRGQLLDLFNEQYQIFNSYTVKNKINR